MLLNDASHASFPSLPLHVIPLAVFLSTGSRFVFQFERGKKCSLRLRRSVECFSYYAYHFFRLHFLLD